MFESDKKNSILIMNCPKCKEKLEFIDLLHRKYWYCYKCKKTFFEEDIKKQF